MSVLRAKTGLHLKYLVLSKCVFEGLFNLILFKLSKYDNVKRKAWV